MTIRVPRDMPAIPRASRHRIAKPLTASLAQGHLDLLAHLGGQQLSQCVDEFYPDDELDVGTRRWLVWASANTRAVVVSVVPRGATEAVRSMQVAGQYSGGALVVDTENPLVWEQNIGDAPTLDDLADPARVSWVVQVVPGALNEITLETLKVRLHSVSIFEVPRAELRGTEIHVDRRYADPRYYLNDDAAGPDCFGIPHLVNMPRYLRIVCKRHLWNACYMEGLTSSGGLGYLIGGSGAFDGHRILARDCSGSGTTTTPCRGKIYVSSITGGNDFDINLEMVDGTDMTIAGITATGWWPRSGGQLVDQGQAGAVAFEDIGKVAFKRNVGSGTITLTHVGVVEAFS